MKSNKVIKTKNLPSKLPITWTAIAYLLLDKFHPAGWVYGVVCTLGAILWIVGSIAVVNQEEVDIFEK